MAANNNLELIPESLCRCWGEAGRGAGAHSAESPEAWLEPTLRSSTIQNGWVQLALGMKIPQSCASNSLVGFPGAPLGGH